MKLYASDNSGNSWKIRILLSILDVPCERIDMDFFGKREHKSPGFLQINPRGQVPAMEIEGQYFWDSTAHLVYIARKWGGEQWLPTDPLGMAEVMHWMAFAQNQVQFGLQWARGVVLKLKTSGDLADMRRQGELGLKIMNEHLRDKDWLAVGRTTIADIACYPYVAKSPEGGFDLAAYPNVLNWVRRCEAQPRWPQRGS
jgi:glutathione S-transferase